MNFHDIVKLIEEKVNMKISAFNVTLELVPGHHEIRVLTDVGTVYVGLATPDGKLTDFAEVKKQGGN